LPRNHNENSWRAPADLIGEAPPVDKPRSRRWVVWVVATLFAALGVPAAYFTIVPAGASPLPWLLARVNGPLLRTPDGKTTLRVYFNDAGAAHSGNHWTWVVKEHALGFKTVELAGYCDTSVAVRGAALPHEWTPEGRLRIEFLDRRYGGTSVTRECSP